MKASFGEQQESLSKATLNLPSCYSIANDNIELGLILIAVRLPHFIIVVSEFCGNIMGIIGDISGNNGVIQRALWNRIIDRF